MTRTTRLLAGLLAVLVTAVPAVAYAVASKSEAASTAEKSALSSAKKPSKPSPATTASKSAPSAKASGPTASKAGPASRTGAADKKPHARAKAATPSTTSKSHRAAAAKTASAKGRTAKRSSRTTAKATTAASHDTVHAVGASSPLAEEGTGPGEALCYRRTTGRGRCEPQCLPYTRCRSGIDSCRIGHENGPVTWFQCEQSRGNTSLEPGDGTILVLGRNKHNMPTGHTLYVEKVAPRGDGRYDLILSHTNYDRRCNLETNAVAVYDKDAKTIDVQTGKWAAWGRDLKVAGFILN